jgi:transketolase
VTSKEGGKGLEPHTIARGIRRRVLEHTIRQNGGYLSQACSSAEILAVLYSRVMNLGPSIAASTPLPFPGSPGAGKTGVFTGAGYNGPRHPDLDRFFFSPVHYALVLYSLLMETGRLSGDALEQFNQDGSTVELIGAEHSPGHEVTAGSLGQCLSQAAGVALVRKQRGESGKVWVFMSDGEFQEGQTWEAVAAMAYHGIDNLGVYVDMNGQQCDGPMESVGRVDPLGQRLESFQAVVREVDGHDIDALVRAGTQPWKGAPLFVLARTNPCQGLDLMRQRAPKLHYVRFSSDEERQQYREVLEGEFGRM